MKFASIPVIAILLISGSVVWKLYSDSIEAEEVARNEQAESNVLAHFEDFVEGRRSASSIERTHLENEVRKRIVEAGISPWQPRFRDGDFRAKWAALKNELDRRAEFREETARIEADARARCAPALGDVCGEMVESWICLTRGECSENAIEGLKVAVFEAEYLQDEIHEQCEDSF